MMAGFSESPDCTTDDTTNDFLIGLLVDVSPSMKKAFSLTLNRSICGNLNRTHAITVALIRIVQQEIAAHKRSDQVFVGAFGLRDVHTCDLISLLKYVLNLSPAEEVSDEILESARKDREEGSNGYINLIGLAMRHGAPHAEIWIKNCLTEPQAGVLYTILTRDENLRKSFISELSGRFTSGFLGVNSAVLSNQLGDVLQNTAQDSNAYKIAVEAINRFTEVITYLQKSIPKPLPIPVQEVSFLIDKLLQNTHMLSSPQAFEANVKDLFGLIEPFIYGGTPMCECLKYTTEVFDLWNVPNKVLFILSDGDSTDGDPVPIGKHLLDSNVTIAPCFITAKEIANPRRLIDKIEGDAEIGAVQLFEMSSTVPNNEPPVTYFIDAGWELPNSGESRLFLQANSIDVVDEFHEIISNHVKNRTCVDALINVLATIDLANYINAGVKPDKQEGNTCYAYAIAAVYHLAMHRNVGGILTIPSFKEMCQELCKLPPNIKYVLEHTSGKYHLKSAKIDKENPENEARRVLNKRRPLVAKFELSKMQWVKFRSFFRKSPKRMLQVNDIPGLLLIVM